MDRAPFCVASSFFQGAGDLLDMATCFKRLGSRGRRHSSRGPSCASDVPHPLHRPLRLRLWEGAPWNCCRLH
eukprot:9692142-Heterocapsa_arctica.AAC.1